MSKWAKTFDVGTVRGIHFFFFLLDSFIGKLNSQHEYLFSSEWITGLCLHRNGLLHGLLIITKHLPQITYKLMGAHLCLIQFTTLYTLTSVTKLYSKLISFLRETFLSSYNWRSGGNDSLFINLTHTNILSSVLWFVEDTAKRRQRERERKRGWDGLEERVPLRSCGSPPGRPGCCPSRPRRYRSTALRSAGRWS